MNELLKNVKNPEKYLSEEELVIQTVTEDWLDTHARDLCGTKEHNKLVESLLAQLKLVEKK